MGISREQALDCFISDDLIGIGMEADAVRRRLHPEGVVSYAIDFPIDLADLDLDHPDRESLKQQEQSGSGPHAFDAQVEAALEQGSTGIVLHGAEAWPIDQVEQILRSLKRRSPTLLLHLASAAAVDALARAAHLQLPATLDRLRTTGLDSILGHGADTLGLSRWIDVHRAAHHAGLPTTAAMTFGAGETFADRVAFLEAVHTLQQETGGFLAFTLESHHAPGGRDLDDATAVEYLKTLAICRMVLDNILHVQANWQQQGLKVLQMGLRFGGNDAGSILAPRNASAPEEEVRRIIRDAGFKPAQRDTLYRSLFLS